VDTEPVTFLGRPLGPSFRARVVTIAAGARLPYVESDWRDALVVVEAGAVELECREGSSRRFSCGNVLWLTGLGLVAVHNRGEVAAVLMAVSRRGSVEPEPD
jgi:hypothetical protein